MSHEQPPPYTEYHHPMLTAGQTHAAEQVPHVVGNAAVTPSVTAASDTLQNLSPPDQSTTPLPNPYS